MSNFAKHLDFLVGSSRVASDDRRALEQWAALNIDDGSGSTRISMIPSPITHGSQGKLTSNVDDDYHDDEDEAWPSVLDEYMNSGLLERSAVTDVTISKLMSKPHIETLLPSLRSLLTSKRPDDGISEELVELIGYDDMELATEVLTRRREVAELLNDPSGGAARSSEMTVVKGMNGKEIRIDLDPEAARKRIEKTLQENAARPLFTGTSYETEAPLPHVYTSTSVAQGNYLSQFGTKFSLHVDTKRLHYDDYEEVILPPARPVPVKATERSISVASLDELCRGSFPGYTALNRIQSIVYDTAYGSNENMLVCAPTGAGKTDVAMLSILRVISQHRQSTDDPKSSLAAQIRKDDLKIIYVAPMKALASEIVRKFDKRLKWLGVSVRELTGDMQMTKAEIAATQLIVTTPEKWDVVTRKRTGEGELASKVKLLIVDEVHLLNDERGAVIETIVARTLRQVESSQTLIRIVGLSATLPNYRDVADFLRVNPYKGLFYFDSSFRPVPLEQHFLGIKGKPNTAQSRRNLDKTAYEKVAALVREGHQVMVFVHARKETVKTAMGLKEAAMADGALEEFSCEEHPQWNFHRREMGTSRNKELKQLFDSGFAIHHAGMLRSDRNLVERFFDAKTIKVLCCTATLAWGVNLPAHAVLIKGTQLYDSSKGKFVDLSVLDVLQIFGRAGRPGYESSGEGYICTTEDMLDHYLEAVNAQNPIESQFQKGMIESLNAEISLGTVMNVRDAVEWLGYTYPLVRMKKNPFNYGLPHSVPSDDKELIAKRRELVYSTAKRLADAGMITYHASSGELSITDLGRIAADYYVSTKSIELFNQKFRPVMSEADMLAMLSESTEFEQIQVRENEVPELKSYLDNEDIVPCQVKGGTDTSQGKVNILLQAYISRVFPEDFALVSDMAYVAQNAGRIIRALLEIAISRKWARSSAVLISLSKSIEKRLWQYQHPLLQFNVRPEVLYNVERWADDLSFSDMTQMTAEELGQLIHMNVHHGAAVLKLAKEFPSLSLTYDLRPLTSDLLRVVVHVSPSFVWTAKREHATEPFWLWLEDPGGQRILQLSRFLVRSTTKTTDIDFVIQLTPDNMEKGLVLRYVSDRWLNAEDEQFISLGELVIPSQFDDYTTVLTLPFLALDVLKHDALKWSFANKGIHNLNALQTHAVWSVCNASQNALLCAPSGAGKSTLVSMLLGKTMLEAHETSWILVVLPKRSYTVSMAKELRVLLESLGISVAIFRDRATKGSGAAKTIKLLTPADLLEAMSKPNWERSLGTLKLIILENLELLDAEYEMSISLLLKSTSRHSIRQVGISASLTDASDLANWLRVPSPTLCCFRPRDREQDLKSTVHTFNIPHSAALLRAMAKPAHAAITAAGADPTIVFVPSRSQCHAVADDLIRQCANASKLQGYLPGHLSVDDIEPYVSRLQDYSLADILSHGIGIYHEGVSKFDRSLVIEMYREGILPVLVMPKDACWSFTERAGCVVVMGTQYLRVERESGEHHVRDYTIPEVSRMQGRAVRHGRSGRFNVFCQAESKETLMRFLEDGLPLESTLHESSLFQDWLYTQWRNGMTSDKQQTIDMLSWTYLARRMLSNPMYYDAVPGAVDESLSRLVDRLLKDEVK